MNFHPSCCYHIYNRGNNKQLVFQDDDNYLFFLKKMKACFHGRADILAYCLMPNHFHLLIKTHESFDDNLNRKIGTMVSSYTQGYNKRNGRTGSLFQPKTKSKNIPEAEYLEICFHYIHQNPLRAGLISNLADWPFSSYLDHAEIRNGSLPNVELARTLLQINNADDFMSKSAQSIDNEKIRGHLYS